MLNGSDNEEQRRREEILNEFCLKFPEHFIAFYEKIDHPRPIKLGTIHAIEGVYKRASKAQMHFEIEAVRLQRRKYKEEIAEVRMRNFVTQKTAKAEAKKARRQVKLDQIEKLNREGEDNYDKIGRKMGLSRERIRQLIQLMGPEQRARLTWPIGRHGERVEYYIICRQCESRTLRRVLPSKSKPTHWLCSDPCKERWRANTQKRMTLRILHRYHHESGFREKTLTRYMTWRRLREKLNPSLREKRLERMRAYSKTHKRQEV